MHRCRLHVQMLFNLELRQLPHSAQLLNIHVAVCRGGALSTRTL